METISVISILSGLFALFVALVGFTVNYIIKSFKEELQQDRVTRAESMSMFGAKVDKVEKFLEKISDEIFARLNKAEKDIDTLWAEHDIFKAGCGTHQHRRKEDQD